MTWAKTDVTKGKYRNKEGNWVWRTSETYREVTGSVDPSKARGKTRVVRHIRNERGQFIGTEVSTYEWTSESYQQYGFDKMMDGVSADSDDPFQKSIVNEWKDMYARMTNDERNRFWKYFHNRYPAKSYPSDGEGNMDTSVFDENFIEFIEDCMRSASASTYSLWSE